MMRLKRLVALMLTAAIMMTASACGNTDTNNEIVVEIEGLTKEYNYFLINDTHLFIGDDEINPDYNELVVSRINEFSLDGMTSAQNFDKWVSNTGKAYDGIILNADIIDQMSYANLSHVKNVLSNVKVPYMYLQSDHDFATDWTILSDEDKKGIEEINNEMGFGKTFYTFEEEEFIILGINYSWMSISEETLEGIKGIFDKKKPIIIVTHVPYDSVLSDDLSKKSMELKNGRSLLWGVREGDNYYPNAPMLEFLNMIMADDSPVKAVIGAHLHTTYETKLTETIPEYLTGTGYSGVRTKLVIKAK